jgi:hypothetical protein
LLFQQKAPLCNPSLQNELSPISQEGQSGRLIPIHPTLNTALMAWRKMTGGWGPIIRSERAAARRRILKDPPDVLLTTPESIEAILASARIYHRALLSGRCCADVRARAKRLSPPADQKGRCADLFLNLAGLLAAVRFWCFGHACNKEVFLAFAGLERR